jgi:phosphatidylcholine synthase
MILLGRAGWLPEPAWCWIAFPLVTSLFAFAHTGAKEEQAGFFRGFPSYWNVVVFYIAVWLHRAGPWWVLAVVLALSALSVAPVRFVYPNRPPRWIALFLGGGLIWLALVLAMIWNYGSIHPLLLYTSLIYPAIYTGLSIYLDLEQRWKNRPE